MRIAIFSNCDLVAHQGSGYVITGFAHGLRALGHQVTPFEPVQLTVGGFSGPAKSYRLVLGMLIGSIRMIFFLPDIMEFYGAKAW